MLSQLNSILKRKTSRLYYFERSMEIRNIRGRWKMCPRRCTESINVHISHGKLLKVKFSRFSPISYLNSPRESENYTQPWIDAVQNIKLASFLVHKFLLVNCCWNNTFHCGIWSMWINFQVGVYPMFTELKSGNVGTNLWLNHKK